MKKSEEQLIAEFKELEAQLITALKSADISIDEKLDAKTAKAQLKEYIKKVKQVKDLFAKYETIANEIEAISSGDKEESREVSDAVVGLRKTKTDTVVEVENINGKIVVKQKQKKAKEHTREL